MNQSESSISIGVFAKYWEPGKVKTRLARTVGDLVAANIHRQLLEFTLDVLRDYRRTGEPSVGESSLYFSPPQFRSEFETLIRSRLENGSKTTSEFSVAGCAAPSREKEKPAVRLCPQADGDLGQRMKSFFVDQFSGDAEKVVLVGSDCAEIDVNVFAESVDALDHHDVVLGPAQDGGYYLIGTRRCYEFLFESMPWSQPELLDETLRRCRKNGVSVGQLDVANDIDTWEDLVGWLKDHRYRGRETTSSPLARKIAEALLSIVDSVPAVREAIE